MMIAPRSVKNGIYRAFLGTVAGIVFAPATQNLVFWLQGDSPDMLVASASARFLSSKDTLRRLLEEMVRLKGPDKK